jgi:hypothetical protein
MWPLYVAGMTSAVSNLTSGVPSQEGPSPGTEDNATPATVLPDTAECSSVLHLRHVSASGTAAGIIPVRLTPNGGSSHAA